MKSPIIIVVPNLDSCVVFCDNVRRIDVWLGMSFGLLYTIERKIGLFFVRCCTQRISLCGFVGAKIVVELIIVLCIQKPIPPCRRRVLGFCGDGLPYQW